MKIVEKLKIVIKKIVGHRKQIISVGMNNEFYREKWVKEKLENLKSGTRLLDAGAGEQKYKGYCSNLIYVSQDFGQYSPVQLNEGLQMNSWDYKELNIISDITSIPELDSSFDAIMCTEVFEHIISPSLALSEFSRLLRKGGELILTAPFASLTHFAPYFFYSGFSKYFYELELKRNGFEILEINYNGNYFEYLAQELLRLPSIIDKYSDIDISEKRYIEDRVKLLLPHFQKLSNSDLGSSELLCFGIQIHARKI